MDILEEYCIIINKKSNLSGRIIDVSFGNEFLLTVLWDNKEESGISLIWISSKRDGVSITIKEFYELFELMTYNEFKLRTILK